MMSVSIKKKIILRISKWQQIKQFTRLEQRSLKNILCLRIANNVKFTEECEYRAACFDKNVYKHVKDGYSIIE